MLLKWILTISTICRTSSIDMNSPTCCDRCCPSLANIPNCSSKGFVWESFIGKSWVVSESLASLPSHPPVIPCEKVFGHPPGQTLGGV